MQDPTKRFTSRVEDYIKYRPSYPEAVITVLRRECGLTAEWVVADLGSGPGNLTHLFLDNGNRVFGVEPNRAMREAGERLLRDHPRFVSIEGTAEATTLANQSVDLVVAGQAFHWFTPDRARQEFRRILRPPQWVALVWNERRITGTPFLVAYEGLLRQYGTDYAAVRHVDGADTAALDALFGRDRYVVATFANSQQFDFAGLRGRLLSSSYTPEAGDPRRDAMLQDTHVLFEAHQSDGVINFDYDTRVYYGRIEGRP
jgi:SAM-dependent methyltransferase